MDDLPKQQVLLVEGMDDLRVITNLLDRHQVPMPFEIQQKGGFEELRASIYNEVNVSGRQILGIVADANDHPDRRWQSISAQLKQAGCRVPNRLEERGSVFRGPRGARVGVWLMPDNRSPGELEDLVADMIPGDDPVWPRARDYIDGIPAKDRKFRPGKLPRAYVHAWLSTRKKPRPMGSAIAADDLRHDATNAGSLVAWLTRLFHV